MFRNQAKKKAEKEAAKQAEKDAKAKKSAFDTIRRKKLSQGVDANVLERVTAYMPLNDTRYLIVDRGEEFDILKRLPDGTASVRRVATGETGLVIEGVFMAPDVLF